jgi:hypothetical protein
MHAASISRRFLHATAAVVAAMLGAAPPHSVAQTASGTQLSAAKIDSMRAMFKKYQDPFVAVHDGYHSTVACVETPNGNMGVHFINMANVGPVPDPAKPVVLLYEPAGKDSLRLTGVEWFVPIATGIKERPVVLGQPMIGPMEGHVPIMNKEDIHYDLHMWLYKDNPAGMFNQTHRSVSCAGQAYRMMTSDAPMEHH